ncbi:DUF2147 domain-containing protein [Microbacteriaceae bacterium K1510]|nr:DUF2147 domain-containing protein [Microbacteriaceae bacterium K1510]
MPWKAAILSALACTAFIMCLTSAVSLDRKASLIDPSGTWAAEDGLTRIRIERCRPTTTRLCGYVVWLKDAADANGEIPRDRFNPDPAMRFRPLLGLQLMTGLAQTPDGHFDGTSYDASSGKSYKVSLWRDAPDRLNVWQCMLWIFCTRETWAPTTNVLPGQLVGMTGDTSVPKRRP